jgi:F-type H+-transporting ATPase subunit gamma
MPSLKDIRRRIGSVKNTQKITKAMKLVSAAKFARANTAVISARPYGEAFDAMVAKVVAAAGDEVESPLLVERPEKRALLVILGSDRGFCGGLNSNLFKAVTRFIGEKKAAGVDVELVPWGKRPRQFAGKGAWKFHDPREKVLDRPTYVTAKEMADSIVKRFADSGYDRVYVAYVRFESALSQSPRVIQVLPLGKPEVAKDAKADPADANILFEPNAKALLEGLLKRAVASRIFRAMLEGAASDHGARMTAMDSATNNASEVLRAMKIEYNRARQAAITKELIEITSGAQAL